MKFLITMKPTALPKQYGRSRGAEYQMEVDASDKNAAALVARNAASAEGFLGYAITDVKEMKQ